MSHSLIKKPQGEPSYRVFFFVYIVLTHHSRASKKLLEHGLTTDPPAQFKRLQQANASLIDAADADLEANSSNADQLTLDDTEFTDSSLPPSELPISDRYHPS